MLTVDSKKVRKNKNKIGMFPKGHYHMKLLNAMKYHKHYLPSFPFKIKHLDENNNSNNNNNNNTNTILSVRHHNNRVMHRFNLKQHDNSNNNNNNDSSVNKSVLPYITKSNFLLQDQCYLRHNRNATNENEFMFFPNHQSFTNTVDIKKRPPTNDFINKLHSPFEITKHNGFSLTKRSFRNYYLSSDKELTFHLKIKDDINSPKNEDENISSLLNLKPSSQLIKSSFAVSIPGKIRGGICKQNQDDYILLTQLPYALNIFGVFDGHGDNGHLVSSYLRSFFIDYFNNYKNILSNLTSLPLINEYLTSLITKSEQRLSTNTLINCAYSGSTCILVFITEEHIICSNIGDSRAILISDTNKVIQMSRDHKPELPDESERIYSHGGVVERSSVNSTCGPFRVWVKNENHPGLAMSRSIGDFIAESVGVVSTPEVNVFKREDVKAKAIVIASDGVWEYVSNEKVKGIIWDYYNRNDAEGCANAIKENAVRMWNANGDIMDDITVVVVFM